jgi:protein-S-isoprenylcysteine O-methyltransferase Ste14
MQGAGNPMLKLIPPFWTAIYLAIAWMVSVTGHWRKLVDPRIVGLGIALVLLGIALSFWAFGLFRREDTELQPTSETNRKLVVSGPYRLTRNPMYLGLVLISLGIAFWVGALPFFVVPLLVLATTNLVHIPFEEAKMRRQFGADYDNYTRAVRRWI